MWKQVQGKALSVPENSTVPQKQEQLMRAMLAVLESIAKDVRGGLLETVGIESYFSMNEGCCSMVLELPENTNTELVARAIDAENIEAWRDTLNKVHIVINPWYSTKDIDQTVLSAIKVIHVLLGIHASDTEQPKSFKQKLLKSIHEVLQIQKDSKK